MYRRLRLKSNKVCIRIRSESTDNRIEVTVFYLLVKAMMGNLMEDRL